MLIHIHVHLIGSSTLCTIIYLGIGILVAMYMSTKQSIISFYAFKLFVISIIILNVIDPINLSRSDKMWWY